MFLYENNLLVRLASVYGGMRGTLVDLCTLTRRALWGLVKAVALIIFASFALFIVAVAPSFVLINWFETGLFFDGWIPAQLGIAVWCGLAFVASAAALVAAVVHFRPRIPRIVPACVSDLVYAAYDGWKDRYCPVVVIKETP